MKKKLKVQCVQDYGWSLEILKNHNPDVEFKLINHTETRLEYIIVGKKDLKKIRKFIDEVLNESN